ncbi:MAG TPA: VOC family protein [Desulfopila sp.]|nr:VOC family protein [Desulfopila sp.]
MKLPKLVGINHVALEVGDIDQALEFYSTIFDFKLRGKGSSSAFLDMGDQFLALSETTVTSEDSHRHFGMVVDDKEQVRKILEQNKVEILGGPFLDFRDPWGNRIQVVDYREIQFTKSDEVLRAMGLKNLKKSEQALNELKDKGMR